MVRKATNITWSRVTAGLVGTALLIAGVVAAG
jgi:hypothetical protein